MSAETNGGGSPRTTELRIALLLGCCSFLFLLPFQHGHFKGSDELAVFEMTRSLFERGDLSIPALRHTEVGADGRRYSYLAPGQSVLALPLYALAGPVRATLPDGWSTALAGPPNRRGAYRFGGELESALVLLFAPLCTAVLVALFYAFERQLGVSRSTGLVLAALFVGSTHALVMSTYFLRHTTVSLTLLGALTLFLRYRNGGALRHLFLGSALASATVLIRVPASIAAPALAAYLAFALHVRRELSQGVGRLARVALAIGVPLAVALALHILVNQAKWGVAFGSPMLEQQGRFNSPLWRGLLGLLLSPGSSVFVYSPLLLLAPAGLLALYARRRAETLLLLALAATFLLFYAKFDGWSGLWSAPGPRYLFPLVPLLLAPLGLWLDAQPRATGYARFSRWTAVGVLATLGFAVQVVSTVVRWGSVPTLAGYPVLGPDQSDFLFQIARSPVFVMSGLLASGGPIDSWLVDLWRGWENFPGRPGAVVALLAVWGALLALCSTLLARSVGEQVPARAPVP